MWAEQLGCETRSVLILGTADEVARRTAAETRSYGATMRN